MSDSRIATLRQLAGDHDAEGLLVTHPPDLRWAVGFSGSNGLLVVTATGAHLVTDGRYTEQARQQVDGADVAIADGALASHVAAAGWLAPGRVVVASDHLAVSSLHSIQKALSGVEIEPVQHLLAEVVAAKSEAEIEGVRQAQALTDAVFETLLPSIRVGVTEQQIAAEIVYAHLRAGAQTMAFEPIVASGRNSALPHARPTARPLAPGDLVVLDMGGVLDGLCSDMTRTVSVGEPGQVARSAYAAVLDAQLAAIDTSRAGLLGSDLDRVARDHLDAAGFGDAFSHSLGHGVGYEVHEWPRLSQQVEHVLPAGATVTIEPGVYLPGHFGIRIEDILVLHENGHENLTRTPKELLVL